MAQKGNDKINVEGDGTVSTAKIRQVIVNVDYPATKEEILQVAQKKGMGTGVKSTLRRLPDREFGSPEEVATAIGRIV